MARRGPRRGRFPRRPASGSSCGSTGPWPPPVPHHRHGGGGGDDRLGHRRVGAAVHDAHRLFDRIRDLETSAGTLRIGLGDLETERLRRSFARGSSPPLSGASVMRGTLSVRPVWPPSNSSPPISARSSSSCCSGAELRRALRAPGDARGARARAGARRPREACPGHRRAGRRGVARPACRLRARPAVGSRVDGNPRAPAPLGGRALVGPLAARLARRPLRGRPAEHPRRRTGRPRKGQAGPRPCEAEGDAAAATRGRNERPGQAAPR